MEFLIWKRDVHVKYWWKTPITFSMFPKKLWNLLYSWFSFIVNQEIKNLKVFLRYQNNLVFLDFKIPSNWTFEAPSLSSTYSFFLNIPPLPIKYSTTRVFEATGGRIFVYFGTSQNFPMKIQHQGRIDLLINIHFIIFLGNDRF